MRYSALAYHRFHRLHQSGRVTERKLLHVAERRRPVAGPSHGRRNRERPPLVMDLALAFWAAFQSKSVVTVTEVVFLCRWKGTTIVPNILGVAARAGTGGLIRAITGDCVLACSWTRICSWWSSALGIRQRTPIDSLCLDLQSLGFPLGLPRLFLCSQVSGGRLMHFARPSKGTFDLWCAG